MYCACCRDTSICDDSCSKNMECKFSKSLSTQQKACLSSPTYQSNKKKTEQIAIMQESDSTLVESSLVTVIGVATDTSQASSSPVNCLQLKSKIIERQCVVHTLIWDGLISQT